LGQPDLKIYNYEEALKVDPQVGKWIQLAQTAALGSHPYILENIPMFLVVGRCHPENPGGYRS
jgi:hypothetical protein